MTDAIRGKRVLVVEDEYLLADDLRSALAEAGAEVIGPVPDAAAALALVEHEGGIDAALLDVNLGDSSAFPVAELLARHRVPFAFTTGYDESELLPRFAGIPRLEKPVKVDDAIELVRSMLA